MGIKIQNIQNKSSKNKSFEIDSILKKEITLFKSGFSNKNKERFYEELSVLLKSGIDLKSSLEIICESFKENLRKKITEMKHGIINGKAFSEILKNQGNFSMYETESISIGEQTGKLASITGDLAIYFTKRNQQKREIISALTYPLIVLFTAILVVFFMLKFVVPMFSDIFKQNGVELPWITQLIIKSSEMLANYGIYLLVCFLMLVGLFFFLKKKAKFNKILDLIVLRLPFIGNYVKKIHLTRMMHTLVLLVNSKIPVVSGLELVRKVISFYPLRSSLGEIEKDILMGSKMSDSFKKFPIYDHKIIAMLKVAEETNQTEFVFQKLYDQYSKELDYQAKNISNILNPLLTLLVGLIVGVILIAMYLPMFRLSSVIG